MPRLVWYWHGELFPSLASDVSISWVSDAFATNTSPMVFRHSETYIVEDMLQPLLQVGHCQLLMANVFGSQLQGLFPFGKHGSILSCILIISYWAKCVVDAVYFVSITFQTILNWNKKII